MSIKVIECIYEKGILRPLVKVDLEEGKRVKVLLKDDREEILDKYAGAVKLDRKVTLKEILEPGGRALAVILEYHYISIHFNKILSGNSGLPADHQ